MADNVELNLGVGGAFIATDEVEGIQHELVKLEFGVDGVATMVSEESPLPVTAPFLSNQSGTWGYNSGTAGTLALTGGKKVLQITAIAEEGPATITINGGDTIVLPYGESDKVSSAITIEPKGNLVNATIIFTNTKAYFCEWVS
jgi:hypothetical protein